MEVRFVSVIYVLVTLENNVSVNRKHLCDKLLSPKCVLIVVNKFISVVVVLLLWTV